MNPRLLVPLLCLLASPAMAWSDLTIPGDQDVTTFGPGSDAYGSTTAVGDLDGDGYDDLVVGDWANSTVDITFGDFSSGDEVLAGGADVQISGSSDELGWAIHVADLDGDGQDDLVAAAPTESVSPGRLGVVYVFYGPLTSGSFTTSDADVEIVAPPATDGGYFGWSLTSGDYDGDGDRELVVGDVSGLTSYARMIHSLGSGRYTLGTGKHAITNIIDEGLLGASMATGDFNGDGLDDLAVSNYGAAIYSAASYAGIVYLAYGRTSWAKSYSLHLADDAALTTMSMARFRGSAMAENIGFSLAMGKVATSPYDTLFIGAPTVECPVDVCGPLPNREGHVYQVDGRADRRLPLGGTRPQLLGEHELSKTDWTIRWDGYSGGDEFGYSVAVVGPHLFGMEPMLAVGAPGMAEVTVFAPPERSGTDRGFWELKHDESGTYLKKNWTRIPANGGYWFKEPVTMWSFLYTHSDMDSRFGHSVSDGSLSGTKGVDLSGNPIGRSDVIVGAPGDTDSTGHVYTVFER